MSEKFQTVYQTPQTVLLETNSMAGGYGAVRSWSKAYDDSAAALTMVATNFARALQHFGDILTVSSYNWKSSEYTANRNPNKGDPPSLPAGIPSELPYGAGTVVGIASSGAYTNGLQTDWIELQDRVTTLVTGSQVPDGDTDKLARAAAMWKTFANSDPLEYGVAQLLAVASGLEQGFGSKVPEDIPNHAANLRKLADKLREIRTAAHDIANAVEAHNAALAKMRADINTQFAAVVTITAISIGRSMVNIKEKPAKEKAPSKQQQSPNDNKVDIDIDFLNDAAWAIAGPANTFLVTLSTLTFTTAMLTNGDLLAIVELPITVTTVDPSGPGQPGTVSAFNGKQEAQEVRDRLAASGQTIAATRNVAVIRGQVDGQSVSLDAVSGKNSPAGTVGVPDSTMFTPVSEDGDVVRPTDSEYKLLETLAQQLSPDSKGTIELYTERKPCPACLSVIKQFEEQYPGVKVKLTSE
ncbi:deaminase domain-containing protein [Nocardia mangyaensis]|uniref:deaminase domain-containing protein n=1 Tax=Nocardia mangyaensis TaxID=2213200 RepID=UPI0026754451|nr:deaminase domain-containing protein [Nocardia mangyaensis]MDO3650907.1 deaminase domain-containing protein [Nocardia mangyaensis]